LSTDQLNLPLKEIYYFGIIDIFTTYSTKKRMEHFFKGLVMNTTKISACHPKYYGDRFLKFITKHLNSSREGGKSFNDPSNLLTYSYSTPIPHNHHPLTMF
jgi:1-phosphatidylinositol-4-phosphate 5-kinase